MQPTRHALPLRNGPETRERHEVVLYDWGNPEAANVTICVHGLTRNAHDFDLLAPVLAETGRRVLAINMPGRGESAWLKNPMDYSYATYVNDCMAIMDNFHLRNVEWIGTSMGGIIGMMIAAMPNSRIKKLVLNDIGSFISRDALQRIYGYVQNIPTQFENHSKAAVYLLQTFKTFGITDPNLWLKFIEGSISRNPDGTYRYACDPAIATPLREMTKDFTEINDVDLSDIWHEVNIPTLIVHGSESDVLSPEVVHHMRLDHVKAQTVNIQGVGHAPSLMEKDQIEIIKRWLIEGKVGNASGMAMATTTSWR